MHAWVKIGPSLIRHVTSSPTWTLRERLSTMGNGGWPWSERCYGGLLSLERSQPGTSLTQVSHKSHTSLTVTQGSHNICRTPILPIYVSFFLHMSPDHSFWILRHQSTSLPCSPLTRTQGNSHAPFSPYMSHPTLRNCHTHPLFPHNHHTPTCKTKITKKVPHHDRRLRRKWRRDVALREGAQHASEDIKRAAGMEVKSPKAHTPDCSYSHYSHLSPPPHFTPQLSHTPMEVKSPTAHTPDCSYSHYSHYSHLSSPPPISHPICHTPNLCHTPHFTPRVPPIFVAYLIRQPLWSSQALGEHSEAFCHLANLLFARDRAWGRGGRSQPRGHPRARGGLFLSRGAPFLSFSY